MSEKIKTVKAALAVAIKKEMEAFSLYLSTSKRIASSGTKKMLEELAEQEKGHQKILEKVVQENKYDGLGADIPKTSFGIADFLLASDLKKNATPQEVMIFAMKEEEKAFHFYKDLKEQFSGTELANLFHRLAEEEKGHKIKLEKEYEQHFLKEN